MTIKEIKENLNKKEYDFLRTNEHLGNNIILLGLGGSYAYGTNIDTPEHTSDIDIRGIALPTKKEILLGNSFEQVIDNSTDTVIYSFKKFIELLTQANPNILEIISVNKDHYLELKPIGQEIIDNKKIFLSKRVIHTFGGYANSQLRRLDNKSMRNLSQAEQETHILNSIKNASHSFSDKYFEFKEDEIKLYLDDAIQEGFDKEIFMDINLKHYPLRDYKCMWSEMHNIVKDYAKIGRRNANAIEHNKLNKHAMHLIRLMYMCIEILETGDIHTYREKEHELLMDIRNGKYMNENNQMIPEFFELVDELEKKMNYAANNTSLPDKPDIKKIDEFVANINEKIVLGL